MPQIKLNINNKKTAENSEEKELIERARQSMEDKKNLPESNSAEKKRGKTGIFILLSVILAAIASAGTFVFADKKNQRPYARFIPESAIASTVLPPEKLSGIFKMPASLIFPAVISAIKSETAVLGVDMEKTLSEIKQDIIIVSVKLSGSELSNVVIAQLPENFERQAMEDKIRQNFNVSYQTYRGEKIINVEPLELSRRDKSFSYAIIENTLLASQNTDALKLSVDAGK